jgi:hypothetical protein
MPGEQLNHSRSSLSYAIRRAQRAGSYEGLPMIAGRVLQRSTSRVSELPGFDRLLKGSLCRMYPPVLPAAPTKRLAIALGSNPMHNEATGRS